MTQTTSSAEYLKLYHYSDAALQLDSNLVGEARSLRGALEHFEATCREGSYRLSVAHVADGMVMYGARAAVVDAWVRVVGLGFQAADGGGLAALLPSWLPPWLVWPGPISWWPDDRRRVELLPVKLPPGPLWPPIPGLVTLLPVILPPWLNRIFPMPGETVRQIPEPLDPVVVNPPDADGSISVALGPLPGNNEPLSQKNPIGDEDLLNARRYSGRAGDKLTTEYNYSNREIKTVRDHIAAYGCLMTSITMLLRSQGKNITVTDLYKANYKRKTNTSIEQDLVNDNDKIPGKDIVLSDLYFVDDTVKDVTEDKYKVVNAKNLPTGDATETLAGSIAEHGSVVIQVSTGTVDGHWIVVDAYDAATKTFTVRDPATGTLVSGVSFGVGGKYTPKGPVKYIKQHVI